MQIVVGESEGGGGEGWRVGEGRAVEKGGRRAVFCDWVLQVRRGLSLLQGEGRGGSGAVLSLRLRLGAAGAARPHLCRAMSSLSGREISARMVASSKARRPGKQRLREGGGDAGAHMRVAVRKMRV